MRSLALKDPPSLEIEDDRRNSALSILAAIGHHECVKLLLLEAEARPNVRAASAALRGLQDRTLQPDATAHCLRIVRLLVAANCPMRGDCVWLEQLLSTH